MVRHDLFLEIRIRLHIDKVLHVWEDCGDDAVVIRETVELRTGDLCHQRLCGGRVMRLAVSA